MSKHLTNYYSIITIMCAAALFFSCATQAALNERLSPPPPTNLVRLADIEKATEDDPARAIHLIGVYRQTYEKTLLAADEEKLAAWYQSAGDNLAEMQKKALAEGRYDDAASLARSLAALGREVESTGEEADILLREARAALDAGRNLAAFLAAFRSNQIETMKADDALPFLVRAYEVKERRNAAYFYEIMAKQNAANIPPEMKEYAQGRDTPQEMIKGVATVLVDRGIKVERGMGVPDRALGSAFFVDGDAKSSLLVTNYHVIASEVSPTYEGYSRLYIRMGDATAPRVPARVVAWDNTMDLALVRVEIAPEYIFSLIDQTDLEVGETVLAIGSPGGLEKTVTRGIVSNLSRRILPTGDVFQLDTAVNPGNSGGPVIDLEGRIVGVVFAGVEQFEGTNFAIPARRLAAALPALLKNVYNKEGKSKKTKAERPWLGLTLAEGDDGAEIIYVAPETTAAAQKISEDSVIVALADTKVAAPQGALIPALQDMLFPRRSGELVAITTEKNGATTRRVVQLALRPDVPLAAAAKIDTKERMAAPLFGIVLEGAVGEVKTPSYLVKKVIRGSPGDEAGISPQDPVMLRGFRLEEKEGYATLDISVKKRLSGYLETTMRLPAMLDTPDTL